MKRILALVLIILAFCFILVSCDEEQEPYIVGAGYDSDNNLVLEYSDGTTLNLGKINQQGEQGAQGEKGDTGENGVGISKTEIVDGELIITYTDGTTQNLGKIVADSNTSAEQEGTDGLEYYPLPDGTYAVSAGTTQYLEEVVIPSKHNGKPVSKILNKAFMDATNLKKVTIGDNVTSIGGGAFANCTSLASVTISDIASWCNISFGDNYSNPLYNAKKLYLNGTLVTELVIPSTVTEIKNYAFSDCTSLTSITIPDSVTYIGDFAFNNCTSLIYNEYNNAYYLGNKANPYVVLVKAKDTSITSCTINETTKFICSSAFEDCTSLASITIPDSVTSIGSIMFYGCSKLTSITIGEGVTSIKRSAFEGCTSLIYNEYDNAYYLGTEENPYFALIKAKNTSITSCKVNEATKIICGKAFESCSSVSSIIIPKSVSYIGAQLFTTSASVKNTTIYCEAQEQPEGWANGWNCYDDYIASDSLIPVVWGYTGE